MTQAQLFAQFQAFLAMKAANQPKKAGRPAKKVDRLATKDQAILRGFARKGIKNVVLMDRTDPTADFNVRPFKGWFALGRVVKRGEHSVRGLFHVSQTEALPQAEEKAPETTEKVVADRAEISRPATKFRLAKQDHQPVA